MSEAAQATHSSPDGHIPQLRFPEFGKRWDKETIGGISKIFGRIGYRGYTVQDIVSKGEGAIALSPSNFINNQINTIKSTYISWFKYEESPEIKILDGDILFVKTGSTYGKTAFVSNIKEKATINPQIVVLKNISISNKFLGYIVTTQTIKKQIEQIVVGGAIPTMSQKELSKMEFSLPAKPEQQKIAAFLTAVDSKIEQLSKKKALLGEYKKGLMQQIFSQAIRFKADDGSDFPNWEEKKLGDFDDLVHGDGDWILSQDITKNGKYEIVQLGNIGFGLFVDKPLKTISEDKFTEINGTQIRKGDLLINRMVDSKLYCCLLKSDDDFITSVDVCWIRKNEYFVNYFLMNLILFKKNQNKLLNLSSGSGRVRISKNNLFNRFSFELPSIEEQTKIANFLSSIDNKIEQVGKQLDESKQFKKALLQQMFV